MAAWTLRSFSMTSRSLCGGDNGNVRSTRRLEVVGLYALVGEPA